MTAFLKVHRVLWIALGAYAAATGALLFACVKLVGGRFIYPLDDAYIHLAIARNFVRHGAWGVNRHEFTSSTSSPLWTALETLGFRIPGAGEFLPLALGILLGFALIAIAYALLRRAGFAGAPLALLLLAVLFAAPLPTLALLGMEHALHALLTAAFAWACAAAWTRPGRGAPWAALALAPALTATRYEGLFAVAAACALFLFRKRFFAALSLAVVAWIPPVAYGLWSLAHGWHFFPNSLLLKASLPESSAWSLFKTLSGLKVLRQALHHPHMLALGLAGLALCAVLWRRRRLDSFAGALNLIFLASLFLHLNFASVGWLFRYEAYLVFLGMLALAIGAREIGAFQKRDTARVAALAMATALAVLLGARAYQALRDTPLASRNIYEQPYRMGLFLRDHFAGKTVVINDIGAAAYLADVDILDLWGLGSLESADWKRARVYGPDSIAAWAKRENADVAVVSDVWFRPLGGLPRSWTPVGRWKIFDNVICGSDTLSVYAIGADAERIATQAREFSRDRPRVLAEFPAPR